MGRNGKRRSTISVTLDSSQRERPFNPFDLPSIHNVIPPPSSFHPRDVCHRTRSLPHRGDSSVVSSKFDSRFDRSPFLSIIPTYLHLTTLRDTPTLRAFAILSNRVVSERDVCWVRRNGGSRIFPPIHPVFVRIERRIQSRSSVVERLPVHTVPFSR